MLQKYAVVSIALSILLVVAAENDVGVRRDNNNINIQRLTKAEKKTIAILGKSAKSKTGKSLKDAKAKKVDSKSSKFLKSDEEEIVDSGVTGCDCCEGSTSRASQSCLKTTVYFVRHGERDKTRVSLGPATTEYNLKWDGDVALITPDNDDEEDDDEVVDDDYSRAAEKPSNIPGNPYRHF